ncbi:MULTISPECIES: hypothetical protein [unclassified Halomonas]|uniref:Uncharacterized protein n=2 Tax=unclassified Halomonas TaxID=2609666 RepID=A0AAU7KCQ5_9GAMM|nr:MULTISPECIES: hypothetical protein [unclassified Halomonas]MBY5941143.1 hypothetical protein [Halomonas sp. DP5N14-9]MBY5984447.1 hypothetical protein [Halomonas sp. DP5Y7-2]MBY6111208.1 hypothetical protein [Halomonas sp. DP1Y21-3]MCO7218106.1 hypothetical protein [Halomonas sp. OfavH-34-E]|tara:strand:- start:2044 stop:2196 length:153 start_codon:yes stop_codon:yes gene_type:complete
MTPADPDFITWWRLWRLLQSGSGTLADQLQARLCWNLSFEVRRRLGDFED